MKALEVFKVFITSLSLKCRYCLQVVYSKEKSGSRAPFLPEIFSDLLIKLFGTHCLIHI